jgi:hypothetical protein
MSILVGFAAAGVGIVVGVAYTWRAMQKAFFSDLLPSAGRAPRNTAGPIRRHHLA